MNQIERAMEQVEQMTPEKGYNLVGVDDYGDPDDQGLYLIGNFATPEEADTELAKRQAANPDVRYYVYGASDKKSGAVIAFMAGQPEE